MIRRQYPGCPATKSWMPAIACFGAQLLLPRQTIDTMLATPLAPITQVPAAIQKANSAADLHFRYKPAVANHI